MNEKPIISNPQGFGGLPAEPPVVESPTLPEDPKTEGGK
jgi:hypothetical protein